MRYYSVFRQAIPHLRARYPRVTHPCATLPTPEGAFSFDLHVLGAPPAFVLSQNQTLHLNLKNYLLKKHSYINPERLTFRVPKQSLAIQISKSGALDFGAGPGIVPRPLSGGCRAMPQENQSGFKFYGGRPPRVKPLKEKKSIFFSL